MWKQHIFSAWFRNCSTFFSASTSRWGILVQYLEGEKRVLKCLSDTRWSARAEATKALSEGYDNIRAALLHIVQDPEQRADTQQEANGLHISLSYLDTVFMTVFWNIILGSQQKQIDACHSKSIIGHSFFKKRVPYYRFRVTCINLFCCVQQS